MLTPKFLRAHPISGTASQGIRWLFKLMYEFWGFCVNGGDSLTEPGGFAPVSGVFTIPWSGSADASLIGSGSDGFTQVGIPYFNTVNPNTFSASYVNKFIVTWKSGSTSTDDSIYQITQWLNSSSVRVDVLQGGTPYTGSLHPSFTTRTNINYRIIDFPLIGGMALTNNTSSLVIQLNGAPLVNTGQRLSQARIKYVVSQPASAYTGGHGLYVTLSPSGTWHGPEFSSGSYSSGSFASGSQVYATGSQPFRFFPTSSVYFTGSYVNLTGSVPNTSTGSLLIGFLTGTFTPTSGGIPSGTFIIPGDGYVLSGTTGAIAQFSGTFDGVEGNYTLTGAFLPVAAPDRLLFSGVYAYSGSGTFTPSGVFSPTGTLLPPGFYSESISEIQQGSGNTSYMWDVNNSAPAYVTMIAATDFFIMHYKNQFIGGASGFHIEIPQRLYPQEVDPNPITCMLFGFQGPTSISSTPGYGYSNGCAMHNPPNNTTINYVGFVRRFWGNSETNVPATATNGRYNGAYFNTYQNKFLFCDIVLAYHALSQFQLSRVRLRRVRILPPIVPQFERVGNNGEWLYVQNGVMWPWDNTLLPYNLFLGGN